MFLAAGSRKLKVSLGPGHWRAAIENVLQLQQQTSAAGESPVGLDLGGPVHLFFHELKEAISQAGLAGAPALHDPRNREIALGLAITCSGVFLAQTSASNFVGLSAKRNRALATGLYGSFYHTGGSFGAAVPSFFWAWGKWPACVAFIAGVQVVTICLALFLWRSDTRTIDTAYTFTMVPIAGAMIALPKLFAFAGALCATAVLLCIVHGTNLGRAIRACARERQGARLVGIDVEHVFALSFGIGLACLGAAACFLLPVYYVNPQVGSGFVLIAFTIVVLGGMGSFVGALAGGLMIGVVESVGGFLLGESLGQIAIFVIFIAVLLFRPQGLFGARA